jgi:hypothetical protein
MDFNNNIKIQHDTINALLFKTHLECNVTCCMVERLSIFGAPSANPATIPIL